MHLRPQGLVTICIVVFRVLGKKIKIVTSPCAQTTNFDFSGTLMGNGTVFVPIANLLQINSLIYTRVYIYCIY